MHSQIKRDISSFRNRTALKIMNAFLLIILPFNVFSLVTNRISTQNMLENAKSVMAVTMQNTISVLDARMTAAQYLLYDLRENNAFFKVLETSIEDNDEYRQARIQVFYRLLELDRLSGTSDVHFIYRKDFDDLLLADKRLNANESEQRFIRDGLMNQNFGTGWNIYRFENSDILLFRMNMGNIELGSWIWLDDHQKILQDGISFQDDSYVFSETAGKNDKNSIVVNVKSGNKDLCLVGKVPVAEIVGSMPSIYHIIQAVSILSFLIIPLLYLVTSRILLRPLEILNKGHHEIQKGNLDYRITEKAPTDEYAHTFDSFNQMTSNIQKLTVENYEKEIEKRDLELQNLQLQIHPHFLLNTFNLIYTMSQNHQEDAVQSTILYLSDYFRYIFREKEVLQIYQKEHHLILGYIGVSKLRYPNRIDFTYDYDPEIMMIRIPPLLIHNFVENVIKHAIQSNEVINITLEGRYSDGMVTFNILDDGAGMPEETVKQLNDSMHSGVFNGEHVGFVNSWKRIQRYYGERGNIEISSEQGIGTCVTISFPYDMEEKDDTTDSE